MRSPSDLIVLERDTDGNSRKLLGKNTPSSIQCNCVSNKSDNKQYEKCDQLCHFFDYVSGVESQKDICVFEKSVKPKIRKIVYNKNIVYCDIGYTFDHQDWPILRKFFVIEFFTKIIQQWCRLEREEIVRCYLLKYESHTIIDVFISFITQSSFDFDCVLLCVRVLAFTRDDRFT